MISILYSIFQTSGIFFLMMKQEILLELAVRSQEFINSHYRQWMGRGSEVAGSSFQICKLSHTGLFSINSACPQSCSSFSCLLVLNGPSDKSVLRDSSYIDVAFLLWYIFPSHTLLPLIKTLKLCKFPFNCSLFYLLGNSKCVIAVIPCLNPFVLAHGTKKKPIPCC